MSTVERYRVTGTLIPVLATGRDATSCVYTSVLVAAAPIAVDIIVRSTDPRFVARTAGWVVTLGYAAWRWETPPDVTRLEE